MKTPSVYCQEKHRQTLKQHPSSFPFQTQFHSSTLHPRAAQGEHGHYSQYTRVPLCHPFPLLPCSNPASSQRLLFLRKKVVCSMGLLIKLQYLLRYQKPSFSPPPPSSLTTVSSTVCHTFPPCPFPVQHFLPLFKIGFCRGAHRWLMGSPVSCGESSGAGNLQLGAASGPSHRHHHCSSPPSELSRDTQCNTKHL